MVSEGTAKEVGYFPPPADVDYSSPATQDWLVPELKAEIEEHWPQEGDWGPNGQVDNAKLAKAAVKLFPPGRVWLNIYQLKQTVEYFASKWGGFRICRQSGYSIICRGNDGRENATRDECHWIIRCVPKLRDFDASQVTMSQRMVKLTTSNYNPKCNLMIDKAVEDNREFRLHHASRTTTTATTNQAGQNKLPAQTIPTSHSSKRMRPNPLEASKSASRRVSPLRTHPGVARAAQSKAAPN